MWISPNSQGCLKEHRQCICHCKFGGSQDDGRELLGKIVVVRQPTQPASESVVIEMDRATKLADLRTIAKKG